MKDVYKLFQHPRQATEIWITTEAAERMAAMLDGPNGRDYTRFLKKLEEYSRHGFALWEGTKRPITPEGDGVFRIGIRSSLFRLLGFYDAVGSDSKGSFIVIEGRLKKDQKLSKADRDAVQRVAETRRSGAWRKMSG